MYAEAYTCKMIILVFTEQILFKNILIWFRRLYLFVTLQVEKCKIKYTVLAERSHLHIKLMQPYITCLILLPVKTPNHIKL